MSLDFFSNQEHQKFIEAQDRYGNPYVNAYNVTIMLSNIMMWPTSACDLFIRFYSQMKKFHTLSLISTVRQHRVQAKLDLRYFLESTVNAAFSLAHPDTKNYFDFERGKIHKAQDATSKANRWLEGTYGGHSSFIKDMKEEINSQTAHAHVANSQHNFELVRDEREAIVTSFFDFDDEELVKVDLWMCAKAGLCAMDLILAVRSDFGGFLPSRDVDGFANLMADSDKVWQELKG